VPVEPVEPAGPVGPPLRVESPWASGAPPAAPPPDGDPDDDGVLPCEPPVAGGVGHPWGCGGGGGPEPPELEPPPAGDPPDWDPLGADEPALPEGDPELPEGDCWPELPGDEGDCWPVLPPEPGLDGDELPEEDGDEGDELGMPLGIELELVVRHPLVASAAAATNTAAVSPVKPCMRWNPWTVAGMDDPAALVLRAWMRPEAGSSTVNANPRRRPLRQRPPRGPPGRPRRGTHAAVRSSDCRRYCAPG